jgi:uncharacterized protein (DUF486 family)
MTCIPVIALITYNFTHLAPYGVRVVDLNYVNQVYAFGWYHHLLCSASISIIVFIASAIAVADRHVRRRE